MRRDLDFALSFRENDTRSREEKRMRLFRQLGKERRLIPLGDQ
jgi:hypothetical protein